MDDNNQLVPYEEADWLKDYDPLFDLFDEEMRSGGQTVPGAHHPASAQATAIATPADLYFNEYDLNNYYYNPMKQHTDELSLILGEYMPYLDLGSPSQSLPASPSSSSSSSMSRQSSTTSPLSSCAPSPSITATTVGSTSSHNPHHHTSTTNQQNTRRRRKSLRTKGTSLLAKPIPKLVCPTSSPVIISSPFVTTLLTINKSADQHLQTPQHMNLTKLDRAKKYCVKIEHAYASVQYLYNY